MNTSATTPAKGAFRPCETGCAVWDGEGAGFAGEMEGAGKADGAKGIEFIRIEEHLRLDGGGDFTSAVAETVGADARRHMVAEGVIANAFAGKDFSGLRRADGGVVAFALISHLLGPCDVMEDCGGGHDLQIGAFLGTQSQRGVLDAQGVVPVMAGAIRIQY